MGLNRNINDDSTLAYLFNKTRQGASDALEKAVAYLKGLIDGKVSKSGDTMTGQLNINGANLIVKNTAAKAGDTPESTSSRHVAIIGSDGNNIAHMSGDVLRTEVGTNEYIGRTRARLTATNGSYTNALQLIQDSNGTRSIYVTSPAAWRNAIGAVNKAGDTMSGSLTTEGNIMVSNVSNDSNIYIKSRNVETATTSPSSRLVGGQLSVLDKNGETLLYILSTQETSGENRTTFRTRKKVNNSNVSFGFTTGVNNDGTGQVILDQVAVWRQALGLGQANGNLPILISQGGTSATGTNTLANNNNNQILTAATNITVTSAEYSSWGKLAMVRVTWKSSQDISVPASGNISNIQVGTLVSGKRPAFTVYGHSNGDEAGAAWYTVQSNGGIYLGAIESTGAARTISAGTAFNIYSIFVLP